ncbi:MAG: hypothetical protein H7Z11_02170 [Verrucomicrobia bacterium]|nr:hypothetical protein [Leptolyngbya sp. ES-bin-22]
MTAVSIEAICLVLEGFSRDRITTQRLPLSRPSRQSDQIQRLSLEINGAC